MKRILILTTLILMISGTMVRADQSILTSSKDTWIENATATHGADTFMYIYGATNTFRPGYVGFDLSSLGPIQITNASLLCTVCAGAPRADTLVTGRFALHGLNNIPGNTPQNWDEATLNQSNSGAEIVFPAGNIVMANVTNLDSDDGVGTTETIVNASSGGWAEGTTITITGQPLIDFLQNRAYDDRLVTFIIRQDASGGRGYGLATKEHATVLEPQLTIDYIRLTQAYLPSPADGSTVPAYTNQVSWRNPDPNDPTQPTITSDVYLGTDPNAMTLIADDTLLETATIPFALTAPATYYWRVDCTDPNAGLIVGNRWSFETSAAPEVAAAPADTAAFVGAPASFAAGFTSTSAITSNKWYKAGDPAVEVSGAGVTIELNYDSGSGVYTSTLTIAGAAVADAGMYYCALGNTGGATNSASAKLIVKRMIAQWQFEGNADDTTGVYNGTLTGTPAFEASGKIGQSMIFDGVDDYIDLPDGFDDFSAGMSITVWSNPSVAANWARFIDFGNGAGGVNILFTRNGTDNTLRFDTANGTVDALNAFTQNEWQMFVVTMTDAGAVTIYKNGLPIQTGTVDLPEVVTRTINYIGESNWTADAFYAGMMDDLRVYNYAITATDVADLYSAVQGPYCLTRPIYDYNNDCLVTLPDFVYMADYWLDCGFYPVSNCQ